MGMRILFVHQSFPGQYRHLIRALAAEGGHQLVGLGIEPLQEPLPKDVTYGRYALGRGTGRDVHPWATETEAKVIRAEACGRAAHQLKEQGFTPDLICAHPGWGGLFLRDIWPDAPLLSYQEFFYNARGFDYDFDPELQGPLEWQACAKLRMKNANPLLMLEASSWNVTPTAFQRSSFPAQFRNRISVIHDGIDTTLASPDPAVSPLTLPDGAVLSAGESTITFVNRRIEPYRGCLSFIRAIPAMQQACPDARIVIVGGHEGVAYGQPAPTGSWRDLCLAQIRGQYDPSGHFPGNLAYGPFLHLLKLSACHVYLTYPACSLEFAGGHEHGIADRWLSYCTGAGGDCDGENGLLVDFFSPQQVAEAVADLLKIGNWR